MRTRPIDPMTGQFLPRSEVERFFENVPGSLSPEECWEWSGSRYLPPGLPYGRFTAAGKKMSSSHRWLLGTLRGEKLSRREWALHTCDNPPCVNPAHLYIGTAKENSRDRDFRGRSNNRVARERAARTHCPQGHEYDEANTYWYRRGGAMCRSCRACTNAAQKRYQDRKTES